MRNIITQKELSEIKKYYNQMGGFGGTLASGAEYYSESGYRRIGIISFETVEDFENFIFESAEVFFDKTTTIEEIRKDVEKLGYSFKLKNGIAIKK